MLAAIKTYYRLTKPGIIYGNLVTTTAGFLLASKGHVNLQLLLATLVGVSLIIAMACVVNNYIDRGIDAKMARTRRRALVTGAIKGWQALVFAVVLGVVGFTALALWTNQLTVLLGMIASFVYIVLYGISKRRSVHGTLVGSIAGALPPVAGYVAVTNQLDMGALLLFVILTAWQMPHFYAIAMSRLGDYTSAHLPVLPVKNGTEVTKRYIVGYILVFIAATLLLSVYSYTGAVYAIVMTLAGFAWLRLAYGGWTASDDGAWARRVFGYSLLILLLFSLMISVAVYLP